MGNARVLHQGGMPIVAIDLARAKIRLTEDGEVAVLGAVHHYLAGWTTRAEEGIAPRPATWPDLTYEYIPGAVLQFPVVPGEADMVIRRLVALLTRPGVLDFLEPPRLGRAPSRGVRRP